MADTHKTAACAVLHTVAEHIGATGADRRTRLADALNMTYHTIYNYEKGQHDATAARLARWCDDVGLVLVYAPGDGETAGGWFAEVKR
jgi:transcriptional regulator with XRE-family HTH domain